jgi:AcrR family transcriptional regulator
MESLFEPDLQELNNLLQSDKPVVQRLQDYVRLSLSHSRKPEELIPLFYDFYSLALRDRYGRDLLRTALARYRSVIAELFQQGINDGTFRAMNPQVAAHALAALYEGLLVHQAIDTLQQGWEGTFQAAAELFISSFLRDRHGA